MSFFSFFFPPVSFYNCFLDYPVHKKYLGSSRSYHQSTAKPQPCFTEKPCLKHLFKEDTNKKGNKCFDQTFNSTKWALLVHNGRAAPALLWFGLKAIRAPGLGALRRLREDGSVGKTKGQGGQGVTKRCELLTLCLCHFWR